MRIVDAEAPLLKDFLEEIESVAVEERANFRVHAGRHPLLGKVVVVESLEGEGVIVEVDA